MNHLNPLLWFIVACALCVFGGPSAFAQERAQETGTVTGMVVDLDTKEPLVGANVVVDGTSWAPARTRTAPTG